MPDVRTASRDDAAPLGEVLARAFVDDPIWSWLVPDAARWDRHSTRFFTSDVRGRLRLGQVFTTIERQGAASWMPPDQWRPSLVDLAREMPGALPLFGSGLVRALRYLSRIERLHPTDRPHWYLAVLGTHPDHQGKGIGSALMQPVLQRCDDEGLPAFLESSKEANIAFYARHGFELRDPIETEGGPTLYPMWREPQG